MKSSNTQIFKYWKIFYNINYWLCREFLYWTKFKWSNIAVVVLNLDLKLNLVYREVSPFI
jgi:surface polysaccharide O-acyltransferase-like enzyme